MNRKHIWIINEYAGSPYHGMEFRHYYLGKELIKLGYDVTIISSSYSHLFKKLPTVTEKYKIENIDGLNYCWLNMLNYGESHNKKRVLKWFSFAFKLLFLPKDLKKPDSIILSPMSTLPVLSTKYLAKKYNVKWIYEVKDIWPLSLIELGGFSPSHPFIKLLSYCEGKALKNANEIVSNLQNYSSHIKSLGIQRKCEWISNGVDLEEMKNIEELENSILDMIPKDKFIIGYTGTIGVANALDYLLEAAKLLEKNTDICFVLVGSGQEKETLIKNYSNLSNVVFIPSIKKVQVQSMLNNFNVNYIGLKNENLFKYGVSPNKLFDYMYSGKPILYAINSGNNIVDEYKCGVSIEAENTEEIKNAVLKLYNMSNDERLELGENGKKYVLEHFTYEQLAKKYDKLLTKDEHANTIS